MTQNFSTKTVTKFAAYYTQSMIKVSLIFLQYNLQNSQIRENASNLTYSIS